MARVSKQFSDKARELMRSRVEYERASRKDSAPGYFKNWQGTYSAEVRFDELCRLYEQCIELSPDEHERFALRYGYAALLREALKLDEAARECGRLIEESTGKNYNVRHLLAYIEARRGDLVRARKLAEEVNADPDAVAFRIADGDLLDQYQSGMA